MTKNGSDPVIGKVKEWLTPILISMVGIMLWAELSDLKRDVKILLANSASTNTKVDMLEKEIDYVRETVCNKPNRKQSYAGEHPINLPPRGVAKKEEETRVPDPQNNVA